MYIEDLRRNGSNQRDNSKKLEDSSKKETTPGRNQEN